MCDQVYGQGCQHQAEDETCAHEKNMTPECNAYVCPEKKRTSAIQTFEQDVAKILRVIADRLDAGLIIVKSFRSRRIADVSTVPVEGVPQLKSPPDCTLELSWREKPESLEGFGLDLRAGFGV